MGRVTYRLKVSGMVQGVGFRASMKEVAILHGVDGWVRNTDEGLVEALVQGDPLRVAKVLEWARVGPPGAEVSSVEAVEVKGSPPQKGFHVLLPEWSRSAANR